MNKTFSNGSAFYLVIKTVFPALKGQLKLAYSFKWVTVCDSGYAQFKCWDQF